MQPLFIGLPYGRVPYTVTGLFVEAITHRSHEICAFSDALLLCSGWGCRVGIDGVLNDDGRWAAAPTIRDDAAHNLASHLLCIKLRRSDAGASGLVKTVHCRTASGGKEQVLSDQEVRLSIEVYHTVDIMG